MYAAEMNSRRERLKSALYLRLKKRFFFKCVGHFHEKLPFSNLSLLLTKTQCSSDITMGDFNKIDGEPFGDKKFQKSRTVPNKNGKEDPFVSSGFVYYV